MGEACRGEGKTAKKDATMKAPMIVMMTSSISIVRIIF
jgi:hypothetical protein